MALIYERMESCGKKVLDTAGVVREAIFRQRSENAACAVMLWNTIPVHSRASVVQQERKSCPRPPVSQSAHH